MSDGHTIGQVILREIIQSPHDKVLRSIYADWLEEFGGRRDRHCERKIDMVAEVGIHNGRWCLRVGGKVLLVEGDRKHDASELERYYDESTASWNWASLQAEMRRLNSLYMHSSTTVVG
jgi:uncharacterized protein (TIGR02996 family)